MKAFGNKQMILEFRIILFKVENYIEIFNNQNIKELLIGKNYDQ